MFEKIYRYSWPLIAILVPILWAYYSNTKNPDLRYTLSEKIPMIVSVDKRAENTQLLKVKNAGNAPAQKIVIKISAEIISYKLDKYAELDTAQVFDQKKPFEISYPELPPQGEFGIALITPSNVVRPTDLIISCSSGIAEEALSKQNATKWGWIYYLLIPFYLLSAIFYLQRSFTQTWQSSSKYKELQVILHSEKPWYISNKEWTQMRKDLLKTNLDNNKFEKALQNTSCYKILSIDRPTHIDVATWQELTEQAEEKLKELYKSIINRCYHSVDEIVKILKTRKPNGLSEPTWEKLEELANKEFFDAKTRETSLSNIVKTLKETKPPEISETCWKNIISHLQDRYYNYTSSQIITANDPLNIIKSCELELLKPEHREELIKKTLETKTKYVLEQADVEKILKETRPEEIPNHHWLQMISFLQKKYCHMIDEAISISKDPLNTITKYNLNLLQNEQQESLNKKAESMKQKLEYDTLITLFTNITHHQKIEDTKRQTLSQQNWETIKKIEEQLLRLEEDKEKYAHALEEAIKTSSLKQKVTNQLELINTILTDPTTINRIEHYNDTFAPGNFANLKRVAEYLKEIQTP